jgi:hypothetical protein
MNQATGERSVSATSGDALSWKALRILRTYEGMVRVVQRTFPVLTGVRISVQASRSEAGG